MNCTTNDWLPLAASENTAATNGYIESCYTSDADSDVYEEKTLLYLSQFSSRRRVSSEYDSVDVSLDSNNSSVELPAAEKSPSESDIVNMSLVSNTPSDESLATKEFYTSSESDIVNMSLVSNTTCDVESVATKELLLSELDTIDMSLLSDITYDVEPLPTKESNCSKIADNKSCVYDSDSCSDIGVYEEKTLRYLREFDAKRKNKIHVKKKLYTANDDDIKVPEAIILPSESDCDSETYEECVMNYLTALPRSSLNDTLGSVCSKVISLQGDVSLNTVLSDDTLVKVLEPGCSSSDDHNAIPPIRSQGDAVTVQMDSKSECNKIRLKSHDDEFTDHNYDSDKDQCADPKNIVYTSTPNCKANVSDKEQCVGSNNIVYTSTPISKANVACLNAGEPGCSSSDDRNAFSQSGSQGDAVTVRMDSISECNDVSYEEQCVGSNNIVYTSTPNSKTNVSDKEQCVNSNNIVTTPNSKANVAVGSAYNSFDASADSSCWSIVTTPIKNDGDETKSVSNREDCEQDDQLSSGSLSELSSFSISDCTNDSVDRNSIVQESPVSVKETAPCLASDIDDSDEYEHMVLSYLDNMYASNIKAPDLKSENNDSDDSELTSSETSSSSNEESDFFPMPRNRKNTLCKTRIWKLLEKEMQDEQWEERVRERKELRKKRPKNINNNRVCDKARPFVRKKVVTPKKLKKRNYRRTEGVVKIINDEVLKDEVVIEMKVADAQEKAMFNELALLDNRPSVYVRRHDFYKSIHLSFLKLNKVITANKTDEEEIVEEIENDGDGDEYQNLICEVCNLRFMKLGRLHNHMTKFHEGNIVTICEFCGKTFCLYDDYSEHFDEVHSGNANGDVICYLCGKDFSNFRPELIAHLQQDHSMWDFYIHKCTNCYLRFANEYMLKQHVLYGCYVCYLCNKLCANDFQDFRVHLMHHYKLPTHVCQFCGKTFFNSRGCIRHIIIKHNGNKALLPHPCDKCDKRFLLKSILDEHVSKCHSDTVFVCDLCNNQFKSVYSLAFHKKKVHDVNETFICNYCDTEFKHKFMIINHLDPDACKCPWCNARLSCATRLADHVMVHSSSSDGKLKCTHCSYGRIANMPQYRRHIIIEHPDVYKTMNKNVIHCDKCGHLCSSQHHFKKHLRLYCKNLRGRVKIPRTKICNFCNVEFSLKERLRNHFKRSNTFCGKCNENFNCHTLYRTHLKSLHRVNDENNHDNDVNDVSYRDVKKSYFFVSNDVNKDNNDIDYDRKINIESRGCFNLNSDGYLSDSSVRILYNRDYLSDTNNEGLNNTTINHLRKYNLMSIDVEVTQTDKKNNKEFSTRLPDYKCNTCDETFQSKYTLSSHERFCSKRLKTVRLRCKFCRTVFKTNSEFELHFSAIKNCLFCGDKFECCYLFDKHINSKSCYSNNPVLCSYILKFKCLICNKKRPFNNIKRFITHYVRFHNKHLKVISEDIVMITFIKKLSTNMSVLQDKENISNNQSSSTCQLSKSSSVQNINVIDDSIKPICLSDNNKLNLTLECSSVRDSLSNVQFESENSVDCGDSLGFNVFNHNLTR